MSDIPALQELAAQFEQLPTAPRPRRRRSPLRVALAAATAGLVGVVGAVVLAPDVTQATIPLTLVNGKLAISYEQVAEDRAGAEAQIQAAGLDVDIVEMPASPSLVGHVGQRVLDEDPIGEDRVDHPFEPLVAPTCADDRYCTPWWPEGVSNHEPNQGWQMGLLVPLDWDATTEIWVGRPAADDEGYRMEAWPWEPGEVLECRRVLMQRVADVREWIDEVDVPVHWRLEDNIGVGTLVDDPDERYLAPQDLDLVGDLVVDSATYGFSEEAPHDLVLWIRRAEPTPEPPDYRSARLEYEEWARRTNDGTC